MRRAVLGAIGTGVVVVFQACGGEAFETTGSGGAGGSGGSSGGSGGSTSSGGSSGTAGSSASGGSSGSSASGGASGSTGSGGSSGSTATGGAGGVQDGCPSFRPTPGDPCPGSVAECTYPTSGCCVDVYRCEAEWSYDGCTGPAVEPTCPPTPPANGAPCDRCSNLTECEYDLCMDHGEHIVATCDGSSWSTSGVSCSMRECAYGSKFLASFEDACVEASDCAIVTIGLDCCGTSLVAGVGAGAAAEVQAAWQDCAPTLPLCGCPTGPPVAEDGSVAADPNTIRVECSAGRCVTTAS